MRAGPISSNYPVIHVVSMWGGVGSRLFVNLLAPVSGFWGRRCLFSHGEFQTCGTPA
jgi:hypothetical protein